jgi:hypothetical protein
MVDATVKPPVLKLVQMASAMNDAATLYQLEIGQHES